MLSKNIDTEFLNDFPKKELKENYEWELISVSKDDINKRSVFFGINKNDKNDCIVKLDDIVVDKDIDTKKLYLIFKGNTVSLNKMINSDYYINLNDDNLIKWIIFQISYGLYILHSNGIIHNDMKPSNILIDEVGGIFISDFGSACFSDEESN